MITAAKPNSESSMPVSLAVSDKHCVFRSGTAWFSLPAVCVREIAVAPPLVRVPLSPASLVGMCHLRSAFVPVISLHDLLDIKTATSMLHQNQLLVINGSAPWALLIAEAAALASLETVMASDPRIDEAKQTPVMGTAMYRDQILRVLDPNRLYSFAQQALDHMWRPPQSAFSQQPRV
jgi:chemotaxis signal transduction protein